MQDLSVYLHGDREGTQAQLFHEKYRNQTGALNHKKLTFLHWIASSEVKCPKTAGQQQRVRTVIPC